MSLPLMLASAGSLWRSVFIATAGIGLAQLLLALVQDSEDFTPALISKHGRVRFFWVLFAFVLLILSAQYSFYRTGEYVVLGPIDEPFAQSLFGFLLMGGVLGAVFRHCCGLLVFKRVCGRPSFEAGMSVIYVWTLIVFLYPDADRHAGFGPYFVLGVAGGVLTHSANRRRSRRRARSRRRVQNLEGWFARNDKLSPAEKEAFELLSDDRKHALLKERLDVWSVQAVGGSQSLTPTLKLIKISLMRLMGEYETHVDLRDVCTRADLSCAVFTALNLGDAGYEDESLAALYQLAQSPMGSRCPALGATLAMRLAEGQFESLPDAVESDEPLTRLNQALVRMRSRDEWGISEDLPDKIAMIVGLPYSSTFVKDATGCCLLATGLFDQARLYFNACIDEDPDYSPAYLHLGDWYVLAAATVRSTRADFNFIVCARLCYRIAVELEGARPSRTKRRALARLEQVEPGSDVYWASRQRLRMENLEPGDLFGGSPADGLGPAGSINSDSSPASQPDGSATSG